MQLVIVLSANPHLNPDRRKHPGKRRRRQQYLSEEHHGVAAIAHRDPSHIPQYRPLGIEIGSADEQDSALDALSGDFLEERTVHIFFDQFRQWCIVSQSGTFEQTVDVVDKNVLSFVFRKNLAQLSIMLSPEESERSNQRAGADACYQIE